MAEKKKSTAKRSTKSTAKSSVKGTTKSSAKTKGTGSGSKTTAKRSKSKNSGSSSKAKNLKRGAEKRMDELSGKRKRQYKHVLESEKKEGRPVKTAKRIAMATVNKTRKDKGETKKGKRS